MNIDLEDQIRERAYSLWQQEGALEGRALDYWSRAEREMAAMHGTMQRATETTVAKAPKKRAPATAAPREQVKAKRGAKAQPLHA